MGAVARVVSDGLKLALAILRPALVFPVAEIFLVDEFDAREPLRLLHAVLAGEEDAQGKAVAAGERLAIHLPTKKIHGAPDALDRDGGGVAFGGVADGVGGFRREGGRSRSGLL